MVSNYCGKDEGKLSLEEMRGEVLAMLKVCFEGEAVAEGDKLRLILPEGRSYRYGQRGLNFRPKIRTYCEKTKRAIDK